MKAEKNKMQTKRFLESMFSGSNVFFNFFDDSFSVTFTETLFSQQFLNRDMLWSDLIFAEDGGYII